VERSRTLIEKRFSLHGLVDGLAGANLRGAVEEDEEGFLAQRFPVHLSAPKTQQPEVHQGVETVRCLRAALAGDRRVSICRRRFTGAQMAGFQEELIHGAGENDVEAKRGAGG
jgi:hypothetical protein